MSAIAYNLKEKSFATTLRTDNWWLEPALVMFGFLSFIVYSTWAAFQADFYFFSGAATSGFGGYLSPMYSPILFVKDGITNGATLEQLGEHAWLGAWPAWMPAFLPASPAFLILPFPGIFRFTCYYYRKAYYRAFAGSPSACAVAAVPQKPFKGETGLLIFQNLHRYALYFAILFIFILSYDAVLGFFRGGSFGVGVGSIVLLINPILLGSYTFGCHSFRHLIAGRMDCMSCNDGRYGAWKKVSWLNSHHQLFAWCSLLWVGFTDIYIRMVSMGVWTDFSTWVN